MKVILRSFLFLILALPFLSNKNIPKPLFAFDQNVNQQIFNRSDSITFFELKRNEFRKEKKYDSALFYTKKLVRLYKKNNDTLKLAKSYQRLGFYNKRLHNYELSFEFFNTSFKTSSSLRDSANAGRRLMDMSTIQNDLGDYIGSEVIAVDALRYLDKTDDYKNIAGAYHSITINKKERGDINGAEEWNEKTLALLNDTLIKKKIKEYYQIDFLNTRANIQVKKQSYIEAIRQYSSLLNNGIIENNKSQLARVKDNLGFAKWLKDSLDPESIKLMKEALIEREGVDDISGLVASNVHLAKFYAFNDVNRAIDYANIALENAMVIKNPVAVSETLGILINLKNKLKQSVNTEAQLYIDTKKKLDGIINKNRSIYEVTKYDNENLRKEKAQKDLEISESQTRNILLGFGIVFLLLISIIAYYIQKQKTKQKVKISKLQERYQTETRLSKRVHDEVGNDIFYLMTQIENDPSLLEKNGLKLLDGLQNIYSKARDISREYTDIDTGEGFPEELLSLLNSFGNKEVKIITKQLEPTFWTPIDTDLKSEVFRIVQELLTNMKKHSQASFVGVTFKKESQKLTIQYSDNGIGVDSDKPTLKSVENRIHVLKGVLTLDAQSDEGLQVSIVIPI
ncbi:MAG: signal transduction histidine kinase [Dokdonia sp.]|jgi:signal transduction histidine kinase